VYCNVVNGVDDYFDNIQTVSIEFEWCSVARADAYCQRCRRLKKKAGQKTIFLTPAANSRQKILEMLKILRWPRNLCKIRTFSPKLSKIHLKERLPTQ